MIVVRNGAVCKVGRRTLRSLVEREEDTRTLSISLLFACIASLSQHCMAVSIAALQQHGYLRATLLT